MNENENENENGQVLHTFVKPTEEQIRMYGSSSLHEIDASETRAEMMRAEMTRAEMTRAEMRERLRGMIDARSSSRIKKKNKDKN